MVGLSRGSLDNSKPIKKKSPSWREAFKNLGFGQAEIKNIF
jgi:hypothetical protein